jgi:predicted  nucleic acid-binding Zn-ribbon protein
MLIAVLIVSITVIFRAWSSESQQSAEYRNEISNLETIIKGNQLSISSLTSAVHEQHGMIRDFEKAAREQESKIKQSQSVIDNISNQLNQQVLSISNQDIGEKCSDAMDWLIEVSQEIGK